ncbi:MAG: hypothetical protein ACM3X0_17410 [Bacteroidota bacterium]
MVCLSALVGCASPAERAARMQAEVDEMIVVYGPACERLGYKRDSDPWRECVIRLASKMEQRNFSYPATTTCVGQHGFFNCTSF